ncbi:MAG: hypothetical protein HEEMFOPI_01166 [Holosporales bacterium]
MKIVYIFLCFFLYSKASDFGSHIFGLDDSRPQSPCIQGEIEKEPDEILITKIGSPDDVLTVYLEKKTGSNDQGIEYKDIKPGTLRFKRGEDYIQIEGSDQRYGSIVILGNLKILPCNEMSYSRLESILISKFLVTPDFFRRTIRI